MIQTEKVYPTPNIILVIMKSWERNMNGFKLASWDIAKKKINGFFLGEKTNKNMRLKLFKLEVNKYNTIQLTEIMYMSVCRMHKATALKFDGKLQGLQGLHFRLYLKGHLNFFLHRIPQKL